MDKKVLLVFLLVVAFSGASSWIFGYPTVGGTVDSKNQNQIDATRFYLNETANVTSITVYITNVQAGAADSVALYSDNAGAPNNLIVNSSNLFPVNGWNVFVIPVTVLSPGYYWIAANSNATNSISNNLVYDSSDYNQVAYKNYNFGSWPSTFPSPSYFQGQYSMYANYTVTTNPNVSYILPTPGSYYVQNSTVNFSVVANDSDNYIKTLVAQVTYPNSTSVNYSVAQLQGQVGGNPAVSGSTSDTFYSGFGTTYYTVVDLVNPVNATTNLTSWQIYAVTSGSVALRIFRNDGGNLDYVGGSGYQSVSAGYNNFSTGIQVKKGDLVGFAMSIPFFSSFSVSANSHANGLEYQTGDVQSSTLKSGWTADNYQMSFSVFGLNGSYVSSFNQTVQPGIYNVTYIASNDLNLFSSSQTYFVVYIPLNANLSLFTQEDFNSPLRTGIYFNNNSTFFANYTNISSGAPFNQSVCTAFFNDSTVLSMMLNSSLQVYTVNRNFSNPGSYSWNVFCYQFPYGTASQNDVFDVHNPAVSTDKSSYRNCGTVYYQINTYNSQGAPINTNLNISILNNSNSSLQQLSVSTTNNNYQGYYLLPPNASSGDWWVNAQTCVNVFQPFMVQTYNTDPWKLSLSFNPDKIHYSTSDVFTATIFALNLNGEGITGLTSSNLSVAVDSSVNPFTEVGNGYYQTSVNAAVLSVGEHVLSVNTKTFGVNVSVSKSFYVG